MHRDAIAMETDSLRRTSMEKKNMGAFLTALRREKGWTQKELAELLHVSDKTVSRWERDESVPDLFLVPDIAQLYGITSDELIRGERKKVTEAESKTESEAKCPWNDSSYREKIWIQYQVRFVFDCVLMAIGGIAVSTLHSLESYFTKIGYAIDAIGFVISLIVIARQIFHVGKLLEEWMQITDTDILWRQFCRKIIFRAEGLISTGICIVVGVAIHTLDMADGSGSFFGIVDPFGEGLVLGGVVCIFAVAYINAQLKKRGIIPSWEDEVKQVKNGENTK